MNNRGSKLNRLLAFIGLSSDRASRVPAKRINLKRPDSLDKKRFRIVSYLFYLSFIVLVGRATIVQLFPSARSTLKTMASRQYQRSIDLAPYRGAILDRRNIPLAISIRTPSLAINPRVFNPSPHQRRLISKLLKLTLANFEKITKRKNYFAWLKRKVPHKTAQRIMSMDLKGLHQFMEPARFYPGGRVAANLLGYVGLDNQGLLGLEAKLDGDLRGQENKILHGRDGRGNSIFYNSVDALPEKSGNNVHLTIDQAIQEITEAALEKAVESSRAKGGFAIVSDPYTGGILAMANYPTFNPNNTSKLNLANTKNQSISNLFEPGSVMKPFVIAAAIQEGLTTLDTLNDCEKSGVYKVGKRNRIHDDHPHGLLTTAEIIVYSSNICTVKIAQKLGNAGLYNAFSSFGFVGKKPILGLAGEAVGRLSNWKRWRPIRQATISFGQGHLVTGLEVVRAYGAIANGGNLVQPFLVDRIESESRNLVNSNHHVHSTQILNPDIARTLREVLHQVVEVGTARRAKTKNFTTGGKTGTAEKVDTGTRGYSKTKRTASFAGFSPVKDPHIVVYVAIDEPRKKPYYGGKWAAPAFSEIVSGTLKYLNVAPDKNLTDKKSTGRIHAPKPKKMKIAKAAFHSVGSSPPSRQKKPR